MGPGRQRNRRKEMTCLSYIFHKNGGTERHVKERVRRAMLAMKNTWSIGERLWNGDFGRRSKMFDALVASIALYRKSGDERERRRWTEQRGST